MTAPHHQWPMKPAEPVAIVRPAPAATARQVDRKQLRRAIDAYCRRVKRGQATLPVFSEARQ